MRRYKVHALVKSNLTFSEKLREINLDNVRFWTDIDFFSATPYATQIPLEKDIPTAKPRLMDEKGIEHLGLIPLNVEVTIEAENEDMARVQGINQINHLLDILTFITGCSIHSAANCTVTEENGSQEKFPVMRICMGWIKPAQQNAEVCFKNVLSILSRTDSILQSKISKAMRYFRKAIGEGDRDIQFLFLWIALECLSQLKKVQKYPFCKVCKKEIRVCMHCNANTIYDLSENNLIKCLLVDETQLLSKSEFDKLYKIRSKLVHGGFGTSTDGSNVMLGVQKLIILVPQAIEKILDQIQFNKK